MSKHIIQTIDDVESALCEGDKDEVGDLACLACLQASAAGKPHMAGRCVGCGVNGALNEHQLCPRCDVQHHPAP